MTAQTKPTLTRDELIRLVAEGLYNSIKWTREDLITSLAQETLGRRRALEEIFKNATSDKIGTIDALAACVEISERSLLDD